MNATKIRLSQPEMELVKDAGMILTKNAILQKAMQLLGQVQERQQSILLAHDGVFPAEVLSTSPKISKGENYRGLPYLVLDYPRIFDKDNIFVIRSMFWWGNFFSSTLLLSGDYRKYFADNINHGEQTWRENEFYSCNNEDPWQHHFGEDNYTPLSAMKAGEFRELNANRPFIKLAGKIPLSMWESADDLLCKNFTMITKILAG